METSLHEVASVGEDGVRNGCEGCVEAGRLDDVPDSVRSWVETCSYHADDAFANTISILARSSPCTT
jgi:hypothetical protein